jgi:Domain of unknown function (DUF4278)
MMNPISYRHPTTTHQQDTAMQLSYRGAKYTVSPSATEVTELDAIGFYRGHVFGIAAPVDRANYPRQRMSYRGIQH